MKKIIALLLVLTLGLSLVGCKDDGLAVETGEVEATPEETTDNQDSGNTDASVEVEELVLADSLNLNIALGNNSRTLTYQQATPLELPDGTIIAQGDLKPTWQYIQGEIGVDLVDVTVQDQKATEMIDLAAATGFTDATVYGGNSIAESLMSYGAQGYFINLKDYLQYMPDFAAYLEENPNVAAAITAYDGGIYHVPYVAEMDNYARLMHGRESWFTALLDSTDALVDESHTLEVAYEGYWDRNATNVVDLQNAAAAGGVLDRDTALEVLLTYIADTYPSLSNPSDLYLGENAQYDMDELVALWRVVELSPNTLSKLETGSVVDGAEISPFFIRKSKYREDVLRLINYFGGQRVYGSDSYAARFYLDENGELHYSYFEDGFLEGVDALADIFSEGLIHSEFADLSNTDDFRKALVFKDNEEGHVQFGFMTHDWIASTTADGSDDERDMVGVLPPLTTIEGYTDEFVHWVENTRVIKPDGWAISAASSEEEINAALTLFNYIFTEAGNTVQNYGIPQNLEEGQVFVSGGVEYPKFNQWLLDAAGEFKSGDISSFLRDFMGSHIPIGYQKEIGFEKQYTSQRGVEAWDLHESVGVMSTSYGAENPLFQLVPPIFSLTEQDTAKINTLAIGDDQRDAIFLYITGADSAVDSVADLKQLYIDGGIEDYIDVYTGAYERMTGQ